MREVSLFNIQYFHAVAKTFNINRAKISDLNFTVVIK